jgi:hypothetical protein
MGLALHRKTGWMPVLVILGLFGSQQSGWAVPMEQDPKGYNGITWGTPFATPPDFAKVNENGKIQTFEYTGARPTFGPVHVESLKVFTIAGQFARVMVRYRGKATHDQVLSYLQSLYGPIDRSPGAMTRGPGQQFNWRGTETEVNLTYETLKELGYIFIDSAVLAPRFNDNLPEHAY